jgi:hypothetical protein
MSETGRNGPKTVTEYSCQGCRWVRERRYAVQGDSGYDVSCGHSSLPSRKTIGDTTWRTPDWCPVLAERGRLKGAK